MGSPGFGPVTSHLELSIPLLIVIIEKTIIPSTKNNLSGGIWLARFPSLNSLVSFPGLVISVHRLRNILESKLKTSPRNAVIKVLIAILSLLFF